MPNTNSQTIHQMGQAINAVVRQATGRDAVQNIDMDFVTVAQNKTVQVFSESVPYIFRRTGGGMNIGNARLSRNKVIGGTLAWNQLVQNGDFASSSGWGTVNGTLSVSGNIATLTASGESTQFYKNIATATNHVYLLSIMANHSESGQDITFQGVTSSMVTTSVAGTWLELTNIGKETNTTHEFNIRATVSVGSTIKYKNAQMFDLTAMFGTTIADYILSLESANAGDGVAWFRKLFPKLYYAYNPGELLSVEGLQSHDMTGFNQWDEQWEGGDILVTTDGQNHSNANRIRSKNYIPVLPDTTYYIKSSYQNTIIAFYDANKSYVSNEVGIGYKVAANTTFITPEWCYYIRFYVNATTYGNDICINFSNPDLNGKYEPYVLHSYPLDSDLILRGIPKLDTDNKLYYDGDEYQADGTVTRKYGIVDLGTVNWQYYTTGTNPLFRAVPLATNAKTWTTGSIPSIKSVKYEPYGVATQSTIASYMPDKHCTFVANSGNFCIRDDAYTDAETFKTAMSGVMLVYELATPTTDTADPFTDPQEVSPYGTEEYISTGIVPVGNETQYLELSDTNM